MPTSLVTGGAGFLGAHVASDLLDRGHSVVVLDDLSGGFEDNVPRGCVRPRICDRRRPRRRLFDEHRFDYVFHLAAYAAEGLSHFIKRFNYTNNVIGSVTLINEAIKHEVKLLRLHVVDRCLRRRADTDDRGHAPRARGPVRDRQARRRAGSPRHARDVRARPHHLPPAQRLRRVPEHRRPLPERRRDLHEPADARRAADGVRRRRADASIQLRR